MTLTAHNMLFLRICFCEVIVMGKRLIDAGRRVLQFETYLQLTGNREIYLENCRSDLQADSRSPESLVIHGQIQSITLTPKGVRHGTASAE